MISVNTKVISVNTKMATMTGDVMPENYFSIDVECVATGIRHDARSVALAHIHIYV